MAFYESYFGHPFPYKKYDQVFCAEFKWGAMENAVNNNKYFYKKFK
jgi:aminopeptidase N